MAKSVQIMKKDISVRLINTIKCNKYDSKLLILEFRIGSFSIWKKERDVNGIKVIRHRRAQAAD